MKGSSSGKLIAKMWGNTLATLCWNCAWRRLLERKWKSFLMCSLMMIHSTIPCMCVWLYMCLCLKYRRQFLSRLRVAFMSPLNKYNISCVLLLITWNPIYCHCQCFMSCYVAWFDLKKSIFDFMKLCYLPNFSSCI